MNRFLEEQKWNYRIIIIPLIIFTLIFLVWAYFSQIDQLVRAEGKVIPSGQTKILQHLEGGIISDILVQEGDNVEKGEVLYILKNDYFDYDLKSQKLELMSLEARAIQLNALIMHKKNIQFPQNLINSIPQIIESERKIFDEEKSLYQSELDSAQNQLNQIHLELNEAQSKLTNLLLELDLTNQTIKIQERLYNQKVISKKKYLTELLGKQRLISQIEEIKISRLKLKEKIKEKEILLLSTDSEFQSKLYNQYSQVQLKIKQFISKDEANRDRDERKKIVSPVKGIVNKLYFHTENGIIRAGDKIAEITPLGDLLIIEAKVKPSDRALVWINQDVSIQFTAYDSAKYGSLKGKIVKISPDSTTDNRGNTYYIVKIKSDNYKFNDDSPILLGMIANCNILSGKRSILYYLIKPLKNIVSKSLSEY